MKDASGCRVRSASVAAAAVNIRRPKRSRVSAYGLTVARDRSLSCGSSLTSFPAPARHKWLHGRELRERPALTKPRRGQCGYGSPPPRDVPIGTFDYTAVCRECQCFLSNFVFPPVAGNLASIEIARPVGNPTARLHQILAPHDDAFVGNAFAIKDFRSRRPGIGQGAVPMTRYDGCGASQAGGL